MSEAILSQMLVDTDNWSLRASLSTVPDLLANSAYVMDGDASHAHYCTLAPGNQLTFDLGAAKQVNRVTVSFAPYTSSMTRGTGSGQVPQTTDARVHIQHSDDGSTWTDLVAADWVSFNDRYGLAAAVQYDSSNTAFYVLNCGLLSIYNATGLTHRYWKLTAVPNTVYITEVELHQSVVLTGGYVRIGYKREFDRKILSVDGSATFSDTALTYVPSEGIITVNDPIWISFTYRGEIFNYGGFRILDYSYDPIARMGTMRFSDRMYQFDDRDVPIDMPVTIADDLRPALERLLTAGGLHMDLVDIPTFPDGTYIPKSSTLKEEVDRLMQALGDVELIQLRDGRFRVISRNDAYYQTVQDGDRSTTWYYVSPSDPYATKDIAFDDKFLPRNWLTFDTYKPAHSWISGQVGYSNYFLQTSARLRAYTNGDSLSDLRVKFNTWNLSGTIRITYRVYRDGVVVGTESVDFATGAGYDYNQLDAKMMLYYRGVPPYYYLLYISVDRITNHGSGSVVETKTSTGIRFSGISSEFPQQPSSFDYVDISIEGISGGTYTLYKTTHVKHALHGYGYTDFVLSTPNAMSYILASANVQLSQIATHLPRIDYLAIARVLACEWDAVAGAPTGRWYDIADEGVSDIVATGTGLICIRIYYSMASAVYYPPISVVYSTTTARPLYSKTISCYVKNPRLCTTSRHGDETVMFNDLLIAQNEWSVAADETEVATSDTLNLKNGQSTSITLYFDDAVSLDSINVNVVIGGSSYNFPAGVLNDSYARGDIQMSMNRTRYNMGVVLQINNNMGTSVERTFTVSVRGKVYRSSAQKIAHSDPESIAEYGRMHKDIDNELVSAITIPYIAKKYLAFSRTPIIIPETVTTQLQLGMDFDTMLSIVEPISGLRLNCECYEIEHVVDGETLNHQTSFLAKVFEFADLNAGLVNLATLKVPVWNGTYDEFAATAVEGEFARVRLTDPQGGGTMYCVKIDGAVRIITTDYITSGEHDYSGVYRPFIPTWYGTYDEFAATIEEGGMRLMLMPGSDGKQWLCKVDGQIQIFA